MLEITHLNTRLSRRNTVDAIVDAWGSTSPEDSSTIFSQLQKGRPIQGLYTYTIPHVFEQGCTDNAPIPYVALATDKGEHFFLDKEFFTLAHGALRHDERTMQVFGGRNGQTYKTSWNDTTVYIKKCSIGTPPYDFVLMHLLEKEGVHIAPLLFATQHIIVTEEVLGTNLATINDTKHGYEAIQRSKGYKTALNIIKEKLIKRKLWEKTMGNKLDVLYDFGEDYSNLFIRDFDSKNPLDWFYFIDCVNWLW